MNRIAADKPKILIVDDEVQITRVVTVACAAQGYEAQAATDGVAALEVLKHWPADLIITDLAMPNMDGIELCRTLRAASTVPILVLSVRDQEKAKVRALDAGADDYVTKPFQINELLARIRAALRRSSYLRSAGQSETIEEGDFRIEPASRQVFLRGLEIHLTPKEFALLHAMAQDPDRILTHRALMTAVWGSYNADQSESLRVLVGQLRKKIEPSDKPHYVLTEPWVGYRFLPEGTAGDPSL